MNNKKYITVQQNAFYNLCKLLPDFDKYIYLFILSLTYNDWLVINKKIPKILQSTQSDSYKKLLKKIICSINPYDNGDTIAVGIEMVINLHYSFMQDILNIKRISDQLVETRDQYIPRIDCTVLYEKNNKDPVFWIRCKTTKIEKLKNMESFKSQMFSYFNFEGSDIYEFYFKKPKTIQKRQIFNFLVDYCEEIVFISDCRFVKKIFPKYIFISNVIKFYFCYILRRRDFTINDDKHVDDFKILNICTILALKFLEKDNLTTYKNDNFSTPVSFLSGKNPINKMNNVARTTQDSNIDDCFTMCNDRDYRIFGETSKIGGNSIHDLQLL